MGQDQPAARRFDCNRSDGLPQELTISIVDDDEWVREALVDLMKSHGYQAEAFDSALAFLDSDRRGTTDCLIADIQMPGMTGLELHSRLVAFKEPIPTILITALPDDAGRAAALRAGVRCYLAKPFDEAELLQCIRAAVDDLPRPRT
jgi:FixJ family two-component response regulator